jgi:peroxiredoxin
MSQLLIGAQAPDFELSDTHGRTYRLSDALLRGPVALVFYKSACPTCQFSFPHIQRMFSALGQAPGLTLWGISEDDVDETKEFAAQHGITFDLLIDEYPYAVSAAYGLQFVPAIFLIQPDGKIAVSEYGFTKAGLNRVGGIEYFKPNDGLPATRPG